MIPQTQVLIQGGTDKKAGGKPRTVPPRATPAGLSHGVPMQLGKGERHAVLSLSPVASPSRQGGEGE